MGKIPSQQLVFDRGDKDKQRKQHLSPPETACAGTALMPSTTTANTAHIITAYVFFWCQLPELRDTKGILPSHSPPPTEISLLAESLNSCLPQPERREAQFASQYFGIILIPWYFNNRDWLGFFLKHLKCL